MNWTVNSNDCARQLDSILVKVREPLANQSLISFKMASRCFSSASSAGILASNVANSFTAVLSPRHQIDECRYKWSQLLQCQKYQLTVEPGYWSGSWNERRLQIGPTAAQKIFASQVLRQCCNRLTDPSGMLTSTSPLKDDDERHCFWWISVQPNRTIWLTLNQFKVKGSNVYFKVLSFNRNQV